MLSIFIASIDLPWLEPHSSGHPAIERLRPLMRTARARIRIAVSMHSGAQRAFRKLRESAAPPF